MGISKILDVIDTHLPLSFKIPKMLSLNIGRAYIGHFKCLNFCNFENHSLIFQIGYFLYLTLKRFKINSSSKGTGFGGCITKNCFCYFYGGFQPPRLGDYIIILFHLSCQRFRNNDSKQARNLLG